MRDIKFRTWDGNNMHYQPEIIVEAEKLNVVKLDLNRILISFGSLMQYTGLKDKHGKDIYEGDVVGLEGVYHFTERKNWEPSSGSWEIIGEKTKNFTGKGEEKYIAGYELTLVEWVEKSCGFEPFSDSDDNCMHCGGGIDPGDIEVIGNVYENPELLNKEN